ncbi:hypothetical protein [Serratia marcescens]|uniref:hypothetical protein n=1 Tax=Serratia marcescens TaxID=615 RepID=UPI00090788AF|nr:hypothetical protein [Serratia marcescens]MCC3248041.1 hypothetical protein [Serratia marcescens]QDL86356.1 hypothetical protein FG183_16610 [Serratia marcescens subsp. marcescens ATCC 13880]QSO56294.1 hypothetical protein J0F99_16505 [Serratia marcescens subsp. marcescens ATCC 13880]QSO61046.1 hypothetical protein J0F91_16515 [Serratia marcescens subsp. marcescens ATCC 13880]QSO65796.1 hypothetical protein J0G00_16505 [Serratia marcescens subsp. marcescens ATCC 13880]
MKKVLLITAILVSGCSSMSEMRSSPPAESFVSKKDAKSISECILFGYQESSFRYGDVYIQPYSNGYTILSPSNIEITDVFNVNGESKIEYRYQGMMMSHRINNRLNKIKHCL